MKIKRAPLLGLIGCILLIILLLTTGVLANKYFKLKTINNALNITIGKQITTIETLKTEKTELETKVSKLEEQLQQQKSTRTIRTTTSRSSTGRFTISAYCHCVKCCGKSDGITATGTKATANRTIAVDPKVIPLGSKVMIDGQIYVAEDTGGAIRGDRIDMYFATHQEAVNFGIQYKDVNIIE